MTENIYDTPEAEVLTDDSEVLTEFYIVAPKKFNILYFATMGLYSIYWFYRNWKLIKRNQRRSIWPVPRAIFSIFFTHSLFSEIEHYLYDKTEKQWNGTMWATICVVFTIVSSILDRLSFNSIGSPVTDILSILVIFPIWVAIFSAQKSANLSCGDEYGKSNEEFSGVNILFIVLGVLFWCMGILGVLMESGHFNIDAL